MGTTLGKNLLKLLSEHKKRQSDLMRYILEKDTLENKDRANFSRYINGRTDFPLDYLQKAAEFFNTDINTLLNTDFQKEIKTSVIPLIGKASCGKPNEYDLNGYEPIPIPNDLYKSGMYAVEADGNSMSPKINDGDIVYCCPGSQIESGMIVHYGIDGESGIKRYKINEAGTIITLIPINTEYDIITIHCDDHIDLQMARVVGRIDKDF